MSIIVLDKATGLPLDPQNPPSNGDWVRETSANGMITEYEWHSPDAPASNPIRIITVRAFMKRFTMTERIAMRSSVDPIVVDLMEDLRLASYVDLDDPDILPGLYYIAGLTSDPDPVIDVAIIAADRVTPLTADGTAAEEYKGVL